MEPDFNDSARKILFSYRHNPLHPRAFQILRRNSSESEDVPIGDYTVLDPEEDIAFSEKKVINLVSLLNGRKRLVPLGAESGARLLFHVPKKKSDSNMSKVVFYTQSGQGVSKENAVFTFEGEVVSDERDNSST